MGPEISVVIPLYNKAPYIERALKSVLSQSFQNFEIIVVDDGSTDGGAEIVKNIKDPRIILVQQENAGVSAARNRGITEATTELIAFLDADDAWERDFLKTIIDLTFEYPYAGAYATSYRIHRTYVKKFILRYKHIPSKPWRGIIRFRHGRIPICASAVAVYKRVFEDVGFFPVGKPVGEDNDMWLRIYLKYPIAYDNIIGCTVYYDGKPRNEPLENRPNIKTAISMINSAKLPNDKVKELKEYVVRCKINMAKYYIFAGNRDLAKKMLDNCETSYLIPSKLLCKAMLRIPTQLVFFLKKIIDRFRG